MQDKKWIILGLILLSIINTYTATSKDTSSNRTPYLNILATLPPIPVLKPTQKRLFFCDKCHKNFAHKGSLQTHQISHSDNPRPFTCTECNKTFTQIGHLTRHFISHSNNSRPFACTECNKTFTQTSHLTTHKELLHSDNSKFFACNICNKNYTTKSHLTFHLIGHSDNPKPFSCDVCNRHYTSSSSLKNHIKSKKHTKKAQEALDAVNNEQFDEEQKMDG